MKTNNIIRTAAAALLMAVTATAQALEVTLHEAGTLAQYISDKYAVNDLTVIGPINGTDIKLIRDMAGCDEQGRTTSGIMTTLDLSGAQIVAGGDAYYNNYTTEDNTIGTYMLAGTKLVKATLPQLVGNIQPGVFARCYNLLEIIVPETTAGLQSVDGVLFAKFSQGVYLWEYPSGKTAASYTVPTAVDKLGTVDHIAFAFIYNDYLQTVEIPSTIVALEGSFLKSGITEITIPASVTTINKQTFQGCSKLEKVTSLITDPYPIDAQTFADGPTARILYVPSGKKTVYENTAGWRLFTDIRELGGETPDVDAERPNVTLSAAGTLAETLAAIDINNAKELTVTGPINGSDLRLIRSMAGCDYRGERTSGKLTKLNLANATITTGGEAYLDATAIKGSSGQLTGTFYFTQDQPNTVGSYLFAGLNLEALQLPAGLLGIDAYAFALCNNLRAISVPSTVSSCSQNMFANSNITAIEWNTTVALQDIIRASAITNPNTIFYLKDSSLAPTGFQNIVVNGTASEIVLTDGYDFYNLKDFTANTITYQHAYTKLSGMGQAKGWETIALPFAPATITHESKGALLPFATWSAGSEAKPFWLYERTATDFTPARSIEPNKPYLICMPNNDSYNQEYRLNGVVTFKATNTTVKATEPVVATWGGNRTFVPAFAAKAPATTVYVMNAEGSVFQQNIAATPFSAYITTDGSYSRPTISIFGNDEQPTAIAEMLKDITTQHNAVYDLQGRKVQSDSKTTGDAPLRKGIYVAGGKKFVVR